MKNSRQEAVLTAVLVAAGLLPLSAKADIFFSKYGEELIYTLHTHLTSPTWRLPSSDEIKLAAVCFINDTAACSDGMFGYGEDVSGDGSGSGGAPDYDLNDRDRCYKEGYTIKDCPEGTKPGGKKCPYGPYYTECISVCPSGYKTCEPPYYGVGEVCDGKYASCEEDTERACKELDSEFTDACQDGWKVDPNNACEYDPTYGKCCNLCEGYDYTTIPEGYIADGAACVDCNGTSKYKIKINPCDGFQDCGVMGGDTGAKTCMSGSQIKYDNCKPCPNLGTLSSCPSPFTCTYEECSNSYYKSGCQSGYDWNASAQTCTAQCSSDYKYTCTSGSYVTGASGTACGGKYKACICSYPYSWNNGSCSCSSSYKYTCSGTNQTGGSGTVCGGKYTSCLCQSPYNWSGGTCSCPSIYRYTCTGVNESPKGTACGELYRYCNCSSGYYWDGLSCTQNDCMKGDEIGYILHSDMTVSSTVQSGKTPIGVVVCSYAGGGGQAMSLFSIATVKWGTGMYAYDGDPRTASMLVASCSESQEILNGGSESDNPAAWAAYNYTTAGTNIGDWCLPAPGVLSSIKAYHSDINNGFSKAKGATFEGNNSIVWSTTASNSFDVWCSDVGYNSNTGLAHYDKNSPLAVRPVIEF